MALELLVGYRLVVENNTQLQFSMWLVALPSRGDHDFPRLIITGRLTHLLEFFDGFRG